MVLPAASAPSGTNRSVHIRKPAAGEALNIASAPGGTLVFAFDPATATAARAGNDLVFELEGGTVRLTDFFVVGDRSLPDLALPGGDTVASADFLAAFGDLDLSTAAGPAAGTPPGGGTSYADAAGSMLGGLDRLGSLLTGYWGSGTAGEFTGLTAPATGAAATGMPLAGPGLPGGGATLPGGGEGTPGGATPGGETPGGQIPGVETPEGGRPGSEAPEGGAPAVSATDDSGTGFLGTVIETRDRQEPVETPAVIVKVDMSGHAAVDAGTLYCDLTGKTLADMRTVAAQAALEGRILYVKGDITIAGNGQLRLFDSSQIVIIDGNIYQNCHSTLNGFIYITGDYIQNANLVVNGGLAVDGNWPCGAAINGTENTSTFTYEAVETEMRVVSEHITTYHVNGITIPIDDLLANDSADAVFDFTYGLALTNGMEKYFTIHADAITEAVRITPVSGMFADSLPDDWSFNFSFDYRVTDAHGRQEAFAAVHVTLEYADANTIAPGSLLLSPGAETGAGVEPAFIPGSGEDQPGGHDNSGVIQANQAGGETRGTDGSRIIYAGGGNDTLTGGSGSDIFVRAGDRLGGNDAMQDFDFNYKWDMQTNTLDSTDGDHDSVRLNFSDLLGEGRGLGDLLSGLACACNADGSFSVSSGTEQGSFSGRFTESRDSAVHDLRITLTDTAHHTVRAIDVHTSDVFHDDSLNTLGEAHAAAILEQILRASC